MTEEARKQVCELLGRDNSGHGMEHIDRVLNLSLKFAEAEGADKEIVSLIALLHDADDYKLFGTECADNLTNAKNILEKCSVPNDVREKVLNSIKAIGYSKRLKGIRPATIEGMTVSDADMCDSMGATGILRSYQYNLAHGNSFFDKNIFPSPNMSAADYMAKKEGTAVTHMFEKLFKLKDLMLTRSGKEEAIGRNKIMIDFLRHFFEEENVPQWSDYLNKYLNDNNLIKNS